MLLNIRAPWRTLQLGIQPDDTLAGEDRRWVRGRKVSAEDLQLLILTQLKHAPSHGYELIKALDTLSNGYYKPSPGVIYPALGKLEAAGLVSATRDGTKKRYQLTAQGQVFLNDQHPRATLLLKRLQHVSRKMTWLRQALDNDPRTLGPEGEDLATGWVPELVDARRGLRQTLLMHTDAPPATQRRIATILQQACRDIDRAAAEPPTAPSHSHQEPRI